MLEWDTGPDLTRPRRRIHALSMTIAVKRVYEAPAAGDGARVLVDRLWPRGISKDRAKIDYWDRDVTPSDELRKWYRHEHRKWSEFKRRYFAELDDNPVALGKLRAVIAAGPVTLVFSSKESDLNNAHALKEYLERCV